MKRKAVHISSSGASSFSKLVLDLTKPEKKSKASAKDQPFELEKAKFIRAQKKQLLDMLCHLPCLSRLPDNLQLIVDYWDAADLWTSIPVQMNGQQIDINQIEVGGYINLEWDGPSPYPKRQYYVARPSQTTLEVVTRGNSFQLIVGKGGQRMAVSTTVWQFPEPPDDHIVPFTQALDDGGGGKRDLN